MNDNESSSPAARAAEPELRQIVREFLDADGALHAANLAWCVAHPSYPPGDARASVSSSWIATVPDPASSAASERRGKALSAMRAALAVQPEPAQPAPVQAITEPKA